MEAEQKECDPLSCELLTEIKAIRKTVDERVDKLLDKLTNTTWISLRAHLITLIAAIVTILGAKVVMGIIEGTAKAHGL